MSVQPVRIQLSRLKGFNLQATSRRINGLPARKVTRPGRWGNPVVIGESWEGDFIDDAGVAVTTFADGIKDGCDPFPKPADIKSGLAGINLACACRLCPAHKENGLPLGAKCNGCSPCHADVLLEIANR